MIGVEVALDSKQKRGSAIGLSLPFRQWLAEPDGTLSATDRVSLVKLCSAVSPASPAGTVLSTVFKSIIIQGARSGQGLIVGR